MNGRHICCIVALLLCTMVLLPAQSNTFPQNSTAGTTEMNGAVRGLDMPNVDISITQPRTGREVAFSVQVLVLLTILTLAPSLLIIIKIQVI